MYSKSAFLDTDEALRLAELSPTPEKRTRKRAAPAKPVPVPMQVLSNITNIPTPEAVPDDTEPSSVDAQVVAPTTSSSTKFTWTEALDKTLKAMFMDKAAFPGPTAIAQTLFEAQWRFPAKNQRKSRLSDEDKFINNMLKNRVTKRMKTLIKKQPETVHKDALSEWLKESFDTENFIRSQSIKAKKGSAPATPSTPQTPSKPKPSPSPAPPATQKKTNPQRNDDDDDYEPEPAPQKDKRSAEAIAVVSDDEEVEHHKSPAKVPKIQETQDDADERTGVAPMTWPITDKLSGEEILSELPVQQSLTPDFSYYTFTTFGSHHNVFFQVDKTEGHLEVFHEYKPIEEPLEVVQTQPETHPPTKFIVPLSADKSAKFRSFIIPLPTECINIEENVHYMQGSSVCGIRFARKTESVIEAMKRKHQAAAEAAAQAAREKEARDKVLSMSYEELMAMLNRNR